MRTPYCKTPQVFCPAQTISYDNNYSLFLFACLSYKRANVITSTNYIVIMTVIYGLFANKVVCGRMHAFISHDITILCLFIF